MTPGGIFDAFDKEVTVWGRADLKDVDDSDLGLRDHLQRLLRHLTRYLRELEKRLTPRSNRVSKLSHGEIQRETYHLVWRNQKWV